MPHKIVFALGILLFGAIHIGTFIHLKGPLTKLILIYGKTTSNDGIQAKSRVNKTVLLYTSSNGIYSVAGWWINDKTPGNCPYKCDYTIDRKFYNTSDAIVFEGLRHEVLNELPPKHEYKNQIWAMFRVESPANSYVGLAKLNSKVNWTISYRWDSDIIWPAARFESGEHLDVPMPTLDSIKDKKLIGWIVSNCHTAGTAPRKAYVKKLREYVPVDVYGRCGKLVCDRSEDCYKILSKTYKFYLAFENSFCGDYVTEKLYRAMRVGMVPVVFAHPSFRKVAIPGSYIDVMDFESAGDLASYLLELDNDPVRYLRYFDWMKQFKFLSDQESMDQSWCAFCEKLHNVTESAGILAFYPSVHDWFYKNYTDPNFCLPIYVNNEGKIICKMNGYI